MRNVGRIGRGSFKGLLRTIVSAVFIVIGIIVAAVPLIWMFLCAFKSNAEIQHIPIIFFPTEYKWQNFVNALTFIPLHLMLINSLVVTCSTVVGVLLTSSLAGYALAKLNFRFRENIFLLILSMMMIPDFTYIVPLFIVIKSLGWINTFWALIVPFIASPFGVFIMRQFILGIPSELMDSARVDGCTELDVYWRIVLPLCKPALATLTVFTFFGAWDLYLWPMLVMNDVEKYTLPLGIDMLSHTAPAGTIGTQYNLIMAGSVFSVIPVVIVFFLAQKQIIKGVAVTGIKG